MGAVPALHGRGSGRHLYARDHARCPAAFKDFRATGITWRAMRGDDPLKIQRAAGHKSLTTTQVYIRIAEDIGRGGGTPFPPLPNDLLGAVFTPCPHMHGQGITTHNLETKSVPRGTPSMLLHAVA